MHTHTALHYQKLLVIIFYSSTTIASFSRVAISSINLPITSPLPKSAKHISLSQIQNRLLREVQWNLQYTPKFGVWFQKRRIWYFPSYLYNISTLRTNLCLKIGHQTDTFKSLLFTFTFYTQISLLSKTKNKMFKKVESVYGAVNSPILAHSYENL